MLAGSVFGLVVAVTPLARSDLASLLVAGFVLLALAAVLSVFWRETAAAPTRADRSRLTYVLVGALVVGTLAFLDFLPRLGIAYPLEGLGFMALTLYMFLLLQALLRRRLLDLHEFLGKIAVVTLLGVVLASIYGGLVSWFGVRPGLFFFNTLVASFVILSLFDPIRSRVEEWVVVNLFRERYELVRELETLRDRVVNVIDPGALERTVLDGLTETRRVTHASLWLVSEDRPGYRLLAFRGPGAGAVPGDRHRAGPPPGRGRRAARRPPRESRPPARRAAGGVPTGERGRGGDPDAGTGWRRSSSASSTPARPWR